MLNDAPSEKPVISNYPPDFDVDLEDIKNHPGSRLCGPIFATSEMESQIIRLEGGDVSILS
jgi:[Skp1-protein]-hydroxyproline N-acetylglucosaminyltransferase